jgi:hypothetical protein
LVVSGATVSVEAIATGSVFLAVELQPRAKKTVEDKRVAIKDNRIVFIKCVSLLSLNMLVVFQTAETFPR